MEDMVKTKQISLMKNIFLAAVTLAATVMNAQAQRIDTTQRGSTSTENSIRLNTKENTPVAAVKNYNLIKLNLTALFLKNYMLQYERTLSRKVSAAISFRYMPSTTLPFKSSIINAVGDDPDTRETLDKFTLSNIAITPEVRFYLNKKGYGRGFYIAPFYRYANFKTNSFIVDYTSDNGKEESINLAGKLTSNTGGFMLGAQWAVGKNLCLDWWIIGPHYGAATGSFSAITTETLSEANQAEIRKQINNIDIPIIRRTVTTTNNSVKLDLNGPWAGVRGGISFGVRF